DELDARERRGRLAAGTPTGFEALDRIIVGMQPSQLLLLAARPSIGKTALAGAIARRTAERGEPVPFVRLEQSGTELGERLRSDLAEVDSQLLRRGSFSEREAEALAEAGRRLGALPLHVSDRANQTALRIAAEARRLHHRRPLGLVVVDYLQLVEPE